jgi:hypothetical protein
MNKTFFLLLIAFLIMQYDGKDCMLGGATTGADDCNGRDKGKDPSGNEYYRCCYFESGQTKMCLPVTKDQYDDIDDAIDKYEDQPGYEEVSIDCGANYIMISLISLILLFL